MPASTTPSRKIASKSAVKGSVAKEFKVLRTDLRRHFDEIPEDATAQRDAIEQGMRDLVKDIERAFNAATATVRDPAVRKDIVAVLEALRGEIVKTVDGAVSRRPGRLTAKAPHKTAARTPARPATRKTVRH